MKFTWLAGFVIAAAVLAFGTLNEFYYSAPWFLQWMDLRWWWHIGAVVYTWIDSVFNLNLPGIDRSGV